MTEFAAVSFDLAHRLASATATLKQHEGRVPFAARVHDILSLGVKVAGTKGRGGVSIEGLNGSSINIGGPVIGGDWKA